MVCLRNSKEVVQLKGSKLRDEQEMRGKGTDPDTELVKGSNRVAGFCLLHVRMAWAARLSRGCRGLEETQRHLL